MLIDALTSSTAPALSGIAGGATGYSDVIDLSVSRDLAVNRVPYSVQFTTPPASGTGGATINAALQTSLDNATWITLEETSPQPIANYPNGSWLMRGFLPAGGQRYYRLAYTPSAALTAGVVLAQLGAEWPRDPTYPRNFVA